MPRISINTMKYKTSDLSKWINRRRTDLKLSQSVLAESIALSQPAFSERLKKGVFTYSELLIILDKLEATDEEKLKLMTLKKQEAKAKSKEYDLAKMQKQLNDIYQLLHQEKEQKNSTADTLASSGAID